MTTRLTIRLDFEAGRRLGAGKVALLESIDRTGSISAVTTMSIIGSAMIEMKPALMPP